MPKELPKYPRRPFTKEDRALEKWATIEEFPFYKVSNMGRVKSKLRYIMTGRTRIVKKPQLIRPGQVENGYLYVMLSHKGQMTKRYVHRLVAPAFFGPMPEEKEEVDHMNRDRTDNRASNLRYVTKLENAENRELAMLKGSEIGTSKLTEDEVLLIRKRAKRGETGTSIAKAYPSLHVDTIRKVISRKLWGHLE